MKEMRVYGVQARGIRNFFVKFPAVVLLCLCSISALFAQSIDELEAKLKTASKEEKPAILNQLAEAYLKSNPARSIDYAEQALKAARRADNPDAETGALINLGDGFSATNNYKKAIVNYKDAIKLFDQYNQPASSAYLWNKVADALLGEQKFAEAVDANTKALDLFKKANDKSGAVSMYLEIGDIYFKQQKYESSLPYYKQALKMYEDSKDMRGQVTILNRIATSYSNWGNYDEASMFATRALDLAKKNNLTSMTREIEKNLDVIKKNLSGYEKSKTEFAQQKEKETAEQMKTKEKQIAYMAAEKEKTIEEIEKLSYEGQAKELKIKAQKDEIKQKALTAENETRKNELLQKEKQLTDAELNKQRLIIWGAIGFSGLGIIFTFFVFNAYRNKKKANDLLKQKNETIYKQREQIEQKNTLITDSIDYAKNIQDAILPPHGLLEKHFPHSFIFYKPKDIVSGDFYWMHDEPDTGSFYLAAADCTGHGVPGAFMSLLGFIMLDEIVRNVHVTPAEILKEVNTQLMEMLHQDSENTTGKFGMDIALIKYDKSKNEIVYAGAHNSLVIINNGQVNEVKANKISIGTSTNVSFDNNTVQTKEGDVIYLYSDGYQDQIGGEKRKKFLAFHFKELLQQVHSLEPEKQRQELEKKHMEWRGKTDQTDDILVIGLKV